jgi:hypothetical protein
MRNDEEWVKQAEENLWELANGAEGVQEKLDKDGCPHMLTYRLPPNLEANKYILNNKAKGKWADKLQVTSTQVNINLTASYNEVTEIINQQKKELIAKKEEQIIDIYATDEDE